MRHLLPIISGYAVEGKTEDKADESGFSFMQRVPWEVVYEEDIYVGYRYYNTFGVPVSYPFGYGKSYTTFEYSNLKISSNTLSDKVTVTVDVKNTGSVGGREVVQLYASAPDGKLEKPQVELVAFAKTGKLEPGASETISFEIEASDLASFDTETSSWITEAGDYTLKVGASAMDVIENTTLNVPETITIEKLHKALAPTVAIDKLTNKLKYPSLNELTNKPINFLQSD